MRKGKQKKTKSFKKHIKKTKLSYLPQITVPWGRSASDYRPGLFTKQYFEKHGDVCCADVYYALSREIEHLNAERIEIGERPFRRPNYSSFARYFHWFLILGLIERTAKTERAIYSFLQSGCSTC